MKYLLSLFNLDKNKLKYFIILFFEKVILVSTHIYFINYLNRDLYGLYNQINFVSGFIVNFSLLGTLVPIVLSAKENNKYDYNKLINSLQLLFLAIIIFFSLIFITFKSEISYLLFGYDDYQNFVFVVFLVVIGDLFSEIYSQKKRIKEELIDYSLFLLSRTITRLTLLFITYELSNSFLFAIVISTLFYYILIINKVKLRFREGVKNFFLEKKNVLRTIRRGFWFLAIYITSTINLLSINLILASKLKLENLAIYNFNYTLATFPLTFITYVIFYSLPGYKKNSHVENSSGVLFRDIAFSLFILVISFLIIFFSYDFILEIVSKNKYYKNSYIFNLIFLSNFILVINSFFQFPLYSKNRFWIIFLIQFTGMIYTVICLFLTINFKLDTPILIVINSNIIMLILYIISNLKYGKQNYFYKK